MGWDSMVRVYAWFGEGEKGESGGSLRFISWMGIGKEIAS